MHFLKYLISIILGNIKIVRTYQKNSISFSRPEVPRVNQRRTRNLLLSSFNISAIMFHGCPWLVQVLLTCLYVWIDELFFCVTVVRSSYDVLIIFILPNDVHTFGIPCRFSQNKQSRQSKFDCVFPLDVKRVLPFVALFNLLFDTRFVSSSSSSSSTSTSPLFPSLLRLFFCLQESPD